MTTTTTLGCARGLTVQIGSFTLGPLDLDLKPGELLCLVGPNGSGKSTLLRSLLGLMPLSDGSVTLLGTEPRQRDRALLRRVGVVPDDPTELIEELTARELWELHILAHERCGTDPAPLRARSVSLAEHLDFVPPDKPISGYSHGMRKKTQIVAALMHQPDLVLLDEPRNGLDPIGIERLETLLVSECRRGTCVLVATHDLRWAERVSDRVAVLARGLIVADGAAPELLAAGETEFAQAFFRLVDDSPRAALGRPG